MRALTLLCGADLLESSGRSSASNVGAAKYYGVALRYASFIEDPQGLRVPAVLVSLWEELVRRGDDGLGSEGIFRLSANQEEVSAVKAALDAGPGAREALSGASSQALAALIKLYLRELPDDVWGEVHAARRCMTERAVQPVYQLTFNLL